jgi:hypothetical protein
MWVRSRGSHPTSSEYANSPNEYAVPKWNPIFIGSFMVSYVLKIFRRKMDAEEGDTAEFEEKKAKVEEEKELS